MGTPLGKKNASSRITILGSSILALSDDSMPLATYIILSFIVVSAPTGIIKAISYSLFARPCRNGTFAFSPGLSDEQLCAKCPQNSFANLSIPPTQRTHHSACVLCGLCLPAPRLCCRRLCLLLPKHLPDIGIDATASTMLLLMLLLPAARAASLRSRPHK